MDKRRLGLGLLFFMLPLAAHADRHKIGFRVGAEDAKRSSLFGWQGSTEIPLARKEGLPAGQKEKRTLSAVLAFSIVAGEHEGRDLTQITYLSGLRYSFNHPGQKRVHVFLQALVGGSHDSVDPIPDRPMAMAGLGLFAPVRDWWGISFELERCVLMGGAKEWYTKGSLGFVWRIEP